MELRMLPFLSGKRGCCGAFPELNLPPLSSCTHRPHQSMHTHPAVLSARAQLQLHVCLLVMQHQHRMLMAPCVDWHLHVLLHCCCSLTAVPLAAPAAWVLGTNSQSSSCCGPFGRRLGGQSCVLLLLLRCVPVQSLQYAALCCLCRLHCCCVCCCRAFGCISLLCCHVLSALAVPLGSGRGLGWEDCGECGGPQAFACACWECPCAAQLRPLAQPVPRLSGPLASHFGYTLSGRTALVGWLVVAHVAA